MNSPIEILREAIRAVPAVRYALGVAGILAAVALVRGLGLDAQTAALGTLGMLALMVVLVVFARLTKTAPRHFVAPMLVLMWSMLLITVASAALFFTSVFFDKPLRMSPLIAEQKHGPPAKPQEDSSLQPPAPEPLGAQSAEDREEIRSELAVASSQRAAADFAGAWATLEALAGKHPGGDVERARVELAMDWLRDGRPGPGRTFTELVTPLLPFFHRAAAEDAGARGADALAHIGWAHFLLARDGAREDAIESSYRAALQRDPNNPFAHTMWGHWILWRSDDLVGAAKHFDAALASGRESTFVRGFSLRAYLNRGALREALAVVLAMRRANDSLPKEERDRVTSRIYGSSDREQWQRLLAAFDAREHLAGFVWLTAGENFASANVLALRRAQLVVAAGQCEQAKALMDDVIRRGLTIVTAEELRAELAACKPRA